MNRDAHYTIRDGVMFNRVGDEIVLLDLDAGTYLGLDAVGSRFWELIAADQTVGTAIETMLEEYEVSRTDLESDIDRFIAELEKNNLIRAK